MSTPTTIDPIVDAPADIEAPVELLLEHNEDLLDLVDDLVDALGLDVAAIEKESLAVTETFTGKSYDIDDREGVELFDIYRGLVIRRMAKAKVAELKAERYRRVLHVAVNEPSCDERGGLE